ncbi:MAG: serine hydrolase, partial [Actinomycetota bacterium]
MRGFVSSGWEQVHDVFRQTIDSKQDVGAAVSLFHRGKCVIDLVGGFFDNGSTKPYEHDTLQLVFSTTKGVTAIAVAICVERGLLSYEEPVALFWPEFAAAGKEHATVAQLLYHQVGLYTAIVMTVVGAFTTPSSQLINGPTNAISIALLSALGTVEDPDSRLQAALVMGLCIGGVQIGIALCRLGDLTR